MKHLKRIAAVLLALAMVLSMSTFTAFAADETGKITISGIASDSANEKTVYEVYCLLDLESYDKDSNIYSYTVNDDWKKFFATDEAKQYFSVDEQGYATWVGDDNRERASAFASLALAYADANDIDPVQSSAPVEAEGDTPAKPTGDMAVGEYEGKPTGTFSGLPLGYYLVDSNVGALCGLTTTNPEAFINAKNGRPTIDKQVKEDLSSNWGSESTADIGQIIEYRTTIKVHAGAENYILHDTMTSGLTFQEVTNVEHIVSGGTTKEVAEGDGYSVKTSDTCGCTFEVVFTKSFCNSLKINDEVIVYYTAMVNENAVIAGAGNTNTTSLEFGEDHFTTEDQTVTYTYAFDLVKTDGQNKPIDGAEFRIYDAATGGKELAVVKVGDKYVRNAELDGTEDAPEGRGEAIVVANGKVRLEGFDNGDYYLEETKTPTGYNQLAGRQPFTISGKNEEATFGADGSLSVGSGVQVVNKSGTMLPETGGIGTTIFYIAGGVLVVAAVVLLITKRRMAK